MPSFARRHYEAIATGLQAAYPDCKSKPFSYPERVSAWSACIMRIADVLVADNPAFNRDRFVNACTPGANVKARGEI